MRLLVEVYNSQRFRFANRARRGLDFASEETQAAWFCRCRSGPTRPDAHSRRDGEMKICEISALIGDVVR